MRDFGADHRWLSINTATVRAQWPLDRIVRECHARGIRAISPWRDQVAAAGLDKIAAVVRETGIELSGYCRGGMFPAADASGRRAALEDLEQVARREGRVVAGNAQLTDALPHRLRAQVAHLGLGHPSQQRGSQRGQRGSLRVGAESAAIGE